VSWHLEVWGKKSQFPRPVFSHLMDYVLTRLYLYIFGDQRSLLLI
jgi:hypothetical protein